MDKKLVYREKKLLSDIFIYRSKSWAWYNRDLSCCLIDYYGYKFAVQTPHISFTGLEDYKARGTEASPYFTVTYYTEFAETKDTVLVRGDVVFTSKLSDAEANWLLQTVQSFYLNDSWYKLVERFNKQTRDFEFKDVLQALNMPNL